MPSISKITQQYGGMKNSEGVKHGGGVKQRGGDELFGISFGEDNKNKDATAATTTATPPEPAVPETAVAEGSQQSKEEPGLFAKLQNAVGLGKGDAGDGADAEAEAKAKAEAEEKAKAEAEAEAEAEEKADANNEPGMMDKLKGMFTSDTTNKDAAAETVESDESGESGESDESDESSDDDDEEKVFITDEQLKRSLKLYGVN